MQRRIKGLFPLVFWRALWQMVVATLGMGVVTYIAVLLLPLRASDQSFLATFPKFTIIAAASLGMYVVFSRWLGLAEASPVIAAARRILFSNILLKRKTNGSNKHS